MNKTYIIRKSFETISEAVAFINAESKDVRMLDEEKASLTRLDVYTNRRYDDKTGKSLDKQDFRVSMTWTINQDENDDLD